MTLIWDLSPHEGRLSGLQIGAPLSSAVNYLRLLQDRVRKVELIYSQSSPLALKMLMNVMDDGAHTSLRLRFEPSSQRLLMVEIVDLSRVILRMDSIVISSPNKDLTFVIVQDLFGPALVGYYDKPHQQYVYSYGGFSLFFAIPSSQESHVVKALSEGKLPIVFPNGTTPVVKKICLFHGDDYSNPVLHPWPVSDAPYFQRTIVHLTLGVFFEFERKKVLFGDSVQDVLSVIGAPTHIFKKSDVRAIIASASKRGENSDYFYNYFERGLDILFDATTHTVKKFILHTNVPDHFDFGRYNKCNFAIVSPMYLQRQRSLGPEAGSSSSPGGQRMGDSAIIAGQTDEAGEAGGDLLKHAAKGKGGLKPSLLVDAPAPSHFAHTVPRADAAFDEYFVLAEEDSEESYQESVSGIIHPNMKWDFVQQIMGRPKGRPVIHNKEVTLNPFDPVHFYGYSGIIFEVMNNSHIASVTVYKS